MPVKQFRVCFATDLPSRTGDRGYCLHVKTLQRCFAGGLGVSKESIGAMTIVIENTLYASFSFDSGQDTAVIS